jgi:hypothetical protein
MANACLMGFFALISVLRFLVNAFLEADLTKGIKGSSPILDCIECKTSVPVPLYRAATFKYCSRKCSYAHRAKNRRTTKICLICDSNFSVIHTRDKTAKYCSAACRYRAMKGRGSVTITCRHCAKEFRASPSQNRRYCSIACVNKAEKSTWRAVFTTVRKNMSRRGLISSCNRCGYSKSPKILGVHHKDRNRKNNDLPNLEILCPNCHSEEHHSHIPH